MDKKSEISGQKIEELEEISTSLWTYVQSQIALFPDGMFTEIDKKGETQTIAYSEAYIRAQKICTALNTRDLQAETEIILCFDSALDFIPSAWACILGGYTWVPWSTSELERNENTFLDGFQSLLKKLDAPWIMSSAEPYSLFERQHMDIDSARLIDINSLGHTDSDFERTKPVNEGSSEQGGSLMTTSGTTGQPKLACISNHTMLNRLRCVKNRYPAGTDTVTFENSLQCFPLHSITGLSILFPIRPHTIYFSPYRMASHPQDLLSAIERLEVQQFGLSSYMAAMLVDSIDRTEQRYDLSSLKILSFGADFISPQIVEKLITRLQNFGAKEFEVTFGYGMTESGLICSSSYSIKYLLSLYRENIHLTEIGKCANGINLRIVDDKEKIIPEEHIGNVQIKSEHKLFSGYLGNPNLTKNSFTTDGWFKTGDVGVINDGKLTLTGREKTKFIIDGKSISLEQIEAPLRDLSGLRQSIVIASSLLTNESISEELAVFFAPETFNKSLLEELGNKIMREVARNVGANVKHLIPIDDGDIERTATGKIRRDQMVENYLRGKWKNLLSRSSEKQKNDNAKSTGYLPDLWKDILELSTAPPSLDESFFHLGGDSLKAARLISAVETKFDCQLPLTEFYKDPTIKNLQEIINSIEDSQDQIQTSEGKSDNYQLLHKIQSYVGGWKGIRQFDDSLVVGRNTDGKNTPIFWVFSNDEQFQTLAIKLGKHQPLYGMRSCADIILVKDYTSEVIQTVAERYLKEILALPVESPKILGGNCQGGIIALAIAKLLKQSGKTPERLILMEWGFSFGKYTDPVHFIYGDDSYINDIYTNPQTANIDWQQDFPNHEVFSISGNHDTSFDDPHIKSLMATLTGNNLQRIRWKLIINLRTKVDRIMQQYRNKKINTS